MNIGERKIFIDISEIPIYTDIEDADMHSAKRYEEVRGVKYNPDWFTRIISLVAIAISLFLIATRALR